MAVHVNPFNGAGLGAFLDADIAVQVIRAYHRRRGVDQAGIAQGALQHVRRRAFQPESPGLDDGLVDRDGDDHAYGLDIVPYRAGRVDQAVVAVEREDFLGALPAVGLFHRLQVIGIDLVVAENAYPAAHVTVPVRQPDKSHLVKEVIGTAERGYDFRFRQRVMVGRKLLLVLPYRITGAGMGHHGVHGVMQVLGKEFPVDRVAEPVAGLSGYLHGAFRRPVHHVVYSLAHVSEEVGQVRTRRGQGSKHEAPVLPGPGYPGHAEIGCAGVKAHVPVAGGARL